MIEILTLEALDDPAAERVTGVLETGGLVVLPDCPFALMPEERAFLDSAILADGAKNVSLDPKGDLSGSSLKGEPRARLAAMVGRYAASAHALIGRLAPAYAPALQRRRTSFRPGPVDSRVLSPRKDDRRLHVDAFPANPVQDRRILRVFTNVNAVGEPRRWHVGEDDFATVAGRMASFARPALGGAWLLEQLGLTKGRRAPYDAVMLELHDRMKLDDVYQASAAKRLIDLQPGASWIVYTDATPHAAIAGRHAFEQTYLLPVGAMMNPDRSPLHVLQRQFGRSLV